MADDDGSTGRTVLVVVLAVVVVAGVAVGAFALGRSKTVLPQPAGIVPVDPSTSSPPASTTTATTDPNDLPFEVASNSAPGITTTSCELSTAGSTAIAQGRFTSSVPPVSTNSSSAYAIDITVYDTQDANIGAGQITFGSSEVSSGQSWQVTVNGIDAGFTPAQCVAALYVQGQ